MRRQRELHVTSINSVWFLLKSCFTAHKRFHPTDMKQGATHVDTCCLPVLADSHFAQIMPSLPLPLLLHSWLELTNYISIKTYSKYNMKFLNSTVNPLLQSFKNFELLWNWTFGLNSFDSTNVSICTYLRIFLSNSKKKMLRGKKKKRLTGSLELCNQHRHKSCVC